MRDEAADTGEAPERGFLSDREWLARQFEELTVEMEVLTPSTWAEQKRYLPPSVTSLPGFYRFEVAPFLREIVDCLSVDSPIREVSVMKGVQVCMTTGVLENAIGYFIDHVKTAPVMLVTADAELAKLRMESYVMPMIQYSGLDHLIRSSDEKNTRKTGRTAKKIEWVGGGFLIPFGAQNANKLRSVSIQVLLRDEIDGWPAIVGKDGDPIKLSTDRTAAYEGSRKIADISTPLIKGSSKIADRFAAGDQRYYYVCCISCGFAQTLRFRRTDPDTGEVSGLVWETEQGRLVPDSVRYRCRNCRHEHYNDDKTRLLSPDNGAEWRPTAKPVSPDHRSYHLNALYSPVGMQTWAACVAKWLEAWDEEHGRPKNVAKLQVFYNNVLGEAFEVRGERLRFEQASATRRPAYCFGQVPNEFALEHCGSPVLLVTCAVDVHKNELPVAVIGWCRGGRAVLLDYWRFEGDTEQLDDPNTWGRLRRLIEQDEYVADDGKRYGIALTFVDSGYRTDVVYRFCAEYQQGVMPVKGREAPPKGAVIKEWSQFQTPMGTRAVNITVDLYKDRWRAALRRKWRGQGLQPHPFFNAPTDATDDQVRELTVEVKRQRVDRITREHVSWEWFRPSGAANELWDLLIYSAAAVDFTAWEVLVQGLGEKGVNVERFWELAESESLYFSPCDRAL